MTSIFAVKWSMCFYVNASTNVKHYIQIHARTVRETVFETETRLGIAVEINTNNCNCICRLNLMFHRFVFVLEKYVIESLEMK